MLCLNGRCSTADLSGLHDQGGSVMSPKPSRFGGNMRPWMALYFGERKVYVRYDEDAAALRDGDIYDLLIRPTGGGPPLLHWRERAKYVVTPRSDCGAAVRQFHVDRT
jgi:hypothetical protein